MTETEKTLIQRIEEAAVGNHILEAENCALRGMMDQMAALVQGEPEAVQGASLVDAMKAMVTRLKQRPLPFVPPGVDELFPPGRPAASEYTPPGKPA